MGKGDDTFNKITFDEETGKFNMLREEVWVNPTNPDPTAEPHILDTYGHAASNRHRIYGE